MRICYFGTYRANYNRNRIMMEGLRQNGVEVVECHEPLWRDTDERIKMASGGWKNLAFLKHAIGTYIRLLRRYRAMSSDYDIMVVGYPGQLDIFLARLLTSLRRKPLVLDAFLSIYLVAKERGLDQSSPFTVNLLYYIERLACRLPNLLILDTEEFANWFAETYNLPRKQIGVTPIGADTKIFQPLDVSSPHASQTTFRVIYYGTFTPNHGVSYIIEAARLLMDDKTVQFELIGDGPDRPSMMDLAEQYGLSNVRFIEWLTQEQLIHRLGKADICLGAFSLTRQSLITVHNKIYECLAMRRTVLSGDSPAICSIMQHGKHLYLCERANPQALAESIRILKEDPAQCRQLAQGGYELFIKNYDIAHVGQRLIAYLKALV